MNPNGLMYLFRKNRNPYFQVTEQSFKVVINSIARLENAAFLKKVLDEEISSVA